MRHPGDRVRDPGDRLRDPGDLLGRGRDGGAAAGAGSCSTPSARKSFSAPGPTSEEYATQGEAAEKSAYV